ncbi:DUF3566 domain-containing protein [Mycetocola lacteus]|uniref:DUF3566 domain-containing protein n=1 Tax=Mycetocola lacteus TaxID=76637 RepID=A0A3L7ATZ2_9MICO|nr:MULTISPECIES: DUF3566 domain-containing protein [Mycetocola]MCS4277965.1 hypothetical protein [Mycetocola sp. BIGb0189]RLP83455.1 DUF3566 domain-containing protein [Mycetocola lacteus]
MSTSVAEKLAKKSNKRQNTKQVRLKLVYIDFWSALKLSFLAAVAIAIITVVFFFLVYTVLQQTGVFEQINNLFKTVAGKEAQDGNDLTAIFDLGRIMGFAAVLAILNLVVVTALGAISAALYNLAVKVTGGVLVGFTNN